MNTINWEQSKYWQIGCGTKHLNGWLNIDALPGPAVDAVFQLNNSKLIPSEKAEWIYWCHGPEHIYPDLLPGLLQDLCRALVPGGKLTIATIDFIGIWQNRFITAANGPHWLSALYGETNSTDPPEAAHRCVFIAETLTQLLSDAGFRSVCRLRPEEYPVILKLNDYATSCRLVTLHLEGIK